MQSVRGHYEPQRTMLPLPELREHERRLVDSIPVPRVSDVR